MKADSASLHDQFSYLIDIIRSTSVDLRCLACSGVVRGCQVVAGGHQREAILLCILCISTPPHCLTQLLSFIFACGAVLRARSQLLGITPQHPASSHTGQEWFTSAAYTHTHTRARVEFTTTALALTEWFLSSNLFWAGQSTSIWLHDSGEPAAVLVLRNDDVRYSKCISCNGALQFFHFSCN